MNKYKKTTTTTITNQFMTIDATGAIFTSNAARCAILVLIVDLKQTSVNRTQTVVIGGKSKRIAA